MNALARRILPAPDEAEAVVKETFLTVWKRASTYDPAQGTPGLWILKIARSKAIDRLDTTSMDSMPLPIGSAEWKDELERIRRATLEPVALATGRWEAVEARLREAPPPQARARSLLLWKVVATAAVLAFGLGLCGYFGRERSDDRRAQRSQDLACERQTEREVLEELRALAGSTAREDAAVSLLLDPASCILTLTARGGLPYAARAVVNVEKKKGLLIAKSLTQQAGKDYELWVIRGERKIAAGLVRPGPEGSAMIDIDPAALTAAPDALAVTMEPEGGMSQPTGPSVLVAAFPKR